MKVIPETRRAIHVMSMFLTDSENGHFCYHGTIIMECKKVTRRDKKP